MLRCNRAGLWCRAPNIDQPILRHGFRHVVQFCAQRDRPRPALGHRAVRHRHVSAGAADDRRRSRRLDRRDADDADGVLRRLRRSARSSTGRCPTWSAASRRSISASRVFAIGAIGCALAPTIEWLIVFRFVQGIGACAGMVIPRADHPRPPHRRRGDAADVAGHAGVQRLADPGAADRQRADRRSFGWRAVFVAVTVVARPRLRRSSPSSCRRRGRRSSASRSGFGSVPRRLSARCSATGASSA